MNAPPQGQQGKKGSGQHKWKKEKKKLVWEAEWLFGFGGQNKKQVTFLCQYSSKDQLIKYPIFDPL